jgi:hypothetical protein
MHPAVPGCDDKNKLLFLKKKCTEMTAAAHECALIRWFSLVRWFTLVLGIKKAYLGDRYDSSGRRQCARTFP